MIIVANFANQAPSSKQMLFRHCDAEVVLRWWSLWVQARVSSGLAASAQTPGKATPPTSPAGRHLSALLQRSPSSLPRPRTSPPRVVVTGRKSAFGTRSSRGLEASPGNPPQLDMLSPARALGNRLRAVSCFSMALPADASATAVSTQFVFPMASIGAFVSSPTVSSPTAPSPLRAAGSHLRGSLIGPRAFGYTPTAPFAELPVSMHTVMSVPDQRFSLGLSLPGAQGPTSSPAVQSAVTMSSAALVPLQLTHVQQPLQADGFSACFVAASNGKTRTVPSSATGSGKASKRASISNSIPNRPAWSPSFTRCTAVDTRLAEDMTPLSRRLTTTSSPHRATGSTQPSPSPVTAVADSLAVEPSSVQAIKRTCSNAVAARLMNTSRIRASTKTAAQPSGVRPTPAQSRASRAAVHGTSMAARAGTTRARPAAPAPAAQRSATRSSKAAASTPAEQSVAVHRQAASGRAGVVQRESSPAPVELRQAKAGNAKTVKKEVAPVRTQPARRAKDPGHTWKF